MIALQITTSYAIAFTKKYNQSFDLDKINKIYLVISYFSSTIAIEDSCDCN